MRTRRSMRVLLCVAVVCAAVASTPHAGLSAAPLPTVAELAGKAELRERLMDNYDILMEYEVRNPGSQSKWYATGSSRWVKHGEKVLIDHTIRHYSQRDGGQKIEQYMLAFDGRIARSVYPVLMRGRISREWREDILRGQKYGPELLGFTFLGGSDETVSSHLRAKPVVNLKTSERIRRAASVVGNGDVDGEPCVIVEVVTTSPAGGALKEISRLYLSERHDCALARAEVVFVRGEPRLICRTTMSSFEQIKEGLWYPKAARCDWYQGAVEPTSSTFFRIVKIEWPESFDERMFVLTFPPGTEVVDSVAGTSYVAGGGDQLVSPKDFAVPEALTPIATVVPHPQGATTIPRGTTAKHTRNAPSAGILVGSIVLVLAAGGLVFVLVRKRRMRRSG